MRPVRFERTSDMCRERSRMRGTNTRSRVPYATNHSTIGIASRQSARASSTMALPPYTMMYQTALVPATTLSRRAGPVCITRLAIRPAKSFWKKVQLCRTTCQWFCQRIRFDIPGAIAWLVTRYCASNAAGRNSSSTAAMPSSWWPATANRRSGLSDDTRLTTRPMKTGIRVSSRATTSPATNRAATSPGACRTKCQ